MTFYGHFKSQYLKKKNLMAILVLMVMSVCTARCTQYTLYGTMDEWNVLTTTV